MKKLTIIISVLFALSIRTYSQIIPNYGFETWVNYVDSGDCSTPHLVYPTPDHWKGSLGYNCLQYDYSFTKNNESYPAGTGQYSLMIKPDIANGVRGVAISNIHPDPMTNWTPKPSFAINYRPSSLCLYYKYLPYGGDTIICEVFFYKNGTVIGNPVFGTTQTISSWTPLQFPMTYLTSDVPDSATIILLTGAFIQHSESILYVDNLNFDSFITAVNEKKFNNEISFYPNPANDFICFNNLKSSGLTINIYNVVGEIVKTEIVNQNNQKVNINDLTNGVYLVAVKSNEQTEIKKLIIQR